MYNCPTSGCTGEACVHAHFHSRVVSRDTCMHACLYMAKDRQEGKKRVPVRVWVKIKSRDVLML